MELAVSHRVARQEKTKLRKKDSILKILTGEKLTEISLKGPASSEPLGVKEAVDVLGDVVPVEHTLVGLELMQPGHYKSHHVEEVALAVGNCSKFR